MQNIRVLIIDSLELATKIPVTIFQNLGYEVDTAFSGAQAIKLYRQFTHGIVTTSMILPDTHGISLINQLRAIQPPHRPTAIATLTTCDNDDIKQRCLNNGVNFYLNKPFTDEMAELIINDYQLQQHARKYHKLKQTA